MNWREFGNIAILAVAVLAVAFALLYGFIAPWYRSPMGRALFGVLASLAIGVTYFGWALFYFPLPPGFYPVRAAIFTALAGSMGSSVILLARAQIKGHPKREAHHELEDARQINPGGPWSRRDGGGGGIPGRGRQRGDAG